MWTEEGECLDDYGNLVVILGVQSPVSLHMISAMQLKQHLQKGCQLFVVSINNREEEDEREPSLDDYLIRQEFKDVFPLEHLGMPPPRVVNFHIGLVVGVEPNLTSPYRMATHELNELNI